MSNKPKTTETPYYKTMNNGFNQDNYFKVTPPKPVESPSIR